MASSFGLWTTFWSLEFGLTAATILLFWKFQWPYTTKIAKDTYCYNYKHYKNCYLPLNINVNDLRMRTMTGRDVFSFGKEEDTQREAFSSCSDFDTFPLKSSCRITFLEFLFLFLIFETNLHVRFFNFSNFFVHDKKGKQYHKKDPIVFVV